MVLVFNFLLLVLFHVKHTVVSARFPLAARNIFLSCFPLVAAGFWAQV